MRHTYLFLTASAVYALFLVRGLHNNHYLAWTRDFQIADCVEIIIFTIPLVYFSLKLFSSKMTYLRDSVWFAFCTSVPFLIYDLLYLGVIKGFGSDYLRTFWFLTIFYFIVWIEIPLIGYLMQKDSREIVKKHLAMLGVAIILWGLNWWEGSFSNHYLSWSLNMKIMRLINVALILLAVVYFFLKYFSEETGYLKDAGFCMLYFSSIFLLSDYFYLGISKGHGVEYLQHYWFVAVFYPLFWIETPLIGWLMQRRAAAERGRYTARLDN